MVYLLLKGLPSGLMVKNSLGTCGHCRGGGRVVAVAGKDSLVEVAEVADSNESGPKSVPILCVRT